MAVRHFKKSWWVDFRHNEIRYRKKSPDNTRAGAKAYEALLRRKLVNGENINRMEITYPTFEEFAWRWFETYVKNNNKPSEIRTKEIALRVHLIPYFGKTKINEISNYQIEGYKAKQDRSRLCNKSINNHLTVLAKCLRTAQEWLELEKIPMIKKLKVPAYKFDYLTKEDSELLLNQAHMPWRDIILVALKTGMRKGELMALHWEDINWETRIIAVKRSMYRGELTSTKSNKIRYIPMIPEVYKCLYSRKTQKGFVFADEQGGPFNRWRFDDTLYRICRQAGLRKITWHVLRHTFASQLAMAGASIPSVQGLLGHSDIATTMRYAHLSSSALTEAISLLDEYKNENFGHQVGTRQEKFMKIVESVALHHPEIFSKIKQKQKPELLS